MAGAMPVPRSMPYTIALPLPRQGRIYSLLMGDYVVHSIVRAECHSILLRDHLLIAMPVSVFRR